MPSILVKRTMAAEPEQKFVKLYFQTHQHEKRMKKRLTALIFLRQEEEDLNQTL